MSIVQSPINSFRGLIDFVCPSEGYISGFVSEFDASQTDRLWQLYCCTRPFSSLINCQTLVGGWENPLRGNLNYTGPSDNHVVAGIQSFYFNRYLIQSTIIHNNFAVQWFFVIIFCPGNIKIAFFFILLGIEGGDLEAVWLKVSECMFLFCFHCLSH